jgi:hypothetical protein
VVDRIPLVHRLLGPEVHDHRLGADRQGPGEHVVRLDSLLQVHEHLAGLVVGGPQVVDVLDAGHSAPGAAVERLHVHRVAHLPGDLGQVERLVVTLAGVGPPHIVDRVLVRHENRVRHLHAEPHQGAVGGVLLHRLERERRVQQIDVVHQRNLLQPLARMVVPVREPVDHEVVPGRGAQVEGFDTDAFGLQGVLLSGVLERSEPTGDRLERPRPVLLHAEEESDEVRRGLAHGDLSWVDVSRDRTGAGGGPAVVATTASRG